MDFTKAQAEAYLRTHAVHPGEPDKIDLVVEGATGSTAAANDLLKAATVVYTKDCIEKLQEPNLVMTGSKKKTVEPVETEPVEEPVEEQA